jgi:hypothetical protein
MRAIKHPSEAVLALHAGGDLGSIARWRTERHLRQCEICQEQVAAFQEVRRMVADLSDMPEIPWNRLAAEMQANIRLGLAAGECVRETESPAPVWNVFTGARTAMAAASLAVLVAAGLMLQKPAPRVSSNRAVEQAVLQAASGSGRDVSYSAKLPGTMATYSVDSITGDVTVTGYTQ